MFEIALQGLVAVLLVVTIAYAFVLNRRLARLRDGRAEMERLIDQLVVAMSNAEQGIATLRKTAFEDDEGLGRRIAEARAMRDEIGFLVDRAETLSARLEDQIAAGRVIERGTARAAAAPSAGGGDDDFYGEPPADGAGGDGDVATARAARATATAWLRNRGRAGPAVAAGDASPRRLR